MSGVKKIYKLIGDIKRILLVFTILPASCIGADLYADSNGLFELSLEELSQITVTTPSKYEQSPDEALANITVITAEMIRDRGYQNLVEILEDLPGYDFATYEDSGEYPSHGVNRGIGGDPGNSKILIMVDDIVQNHIAFNWSMGWGNEQILHDVERIEIIQGPGSALYGANAYSGIINIITKKKYKADGGQIWVKPWIGANNTKALDLMYGGKQGKFHYSFAFRKYNTDGDGGINRPDPGGYFTNNSEPNILTQDYDSTGTYLTNTPNPTAGKPLKDGFNTSKDDFGVRLNLSYLNPKEPGVSGVNEASIGISYWDKRDGLGSYVSGFEYYTADDDFIVHNRNFYIYGNYDYQLSRYFSLKSTLSYRVNQQMPDTGFRYTYRFNKMAKTYESRSEQTALEEQLHILLDDDSHIILGGRVMESKKMEQSISLGKEKSGASHTTDSSWEIANAGEGLFQSKTVPVSKIREHSIYGVWDGKFNENVSYSLGTRTDNSDEYGETTNPRAGISFNVPLAKHLSLEYWKIKLLYGSAFRQPGFFELRDEFRGNSDLAPEKIATFEIENGFRFFSLKQNPSANSLDVKVNLFQSAMHDMISLQPDSTRASGESYVNTGKSWVRGISTFLDFNLLAHFSSYINYIYTQGKDDHNDEWGEISHVAQHKINAGIQWLTLQNYLNINLRMNYVGKRKVPVTNSYFSDYAPGYTKFNLVVSGNKIGPARFREYQIRPELVVKNLLDTKYAGVGRQAGSNDITMLDPDSNPNPAGFIPPYHPQPRRTVALNISMVF